MIGRGWFMGVCVCVCNSPSVCFLTVHQHFQRIVPNQLDNGPDKVIQAAYQVKYNAKKMKK